MDCIELAHFMVVKTHTNGVVLLGFGVRILYRYTFILIFDDREYFIKKLVSKNFSHNKMCKLTLSIYKQCIAEYKRKG